MPEMQLYSKDSRLGPLKIEGKHFFGRGGEGALEGWQSPKAMVGLGVAALR